MRRWEIKWCEDKKDTQLAPFFYEVLQRAEGYFPPDTSLNGTNVDSPGAAEQGMALSRLLLLCVLASEVMWDTETKPEAFLCNRAARKAMNVVPQIQTELSECLGSSVLPTPVQLPCTELHMATWENKSEQEKKADIVASLRLFHEGVKTSRITSEAGCGTLLLQRLESNVENYLLILTHLQLSGPVVSPSLSCVPQSTRSLRTALRSYSHLILGKLEQFVVKLEDRCTSQ